MKYVLLFVFVVLITETFAQQDSTASVPEKSQWSLASVRDGELVILAFVSGNCPFDTYYSSRLKKLIETQQHIRFIGVNSNSDEMSNSGLNSAIGAASGLKTIIFDANAELAGQFDVKKSTHMIFLTKNLGKVKVLYSGPIDNNPQNEKAADQFYLLDAISLYAQGKMPVQKTTGVMGCVIR